MSKTTKQDALSNDIPTAEDEVNEEQSNLHHPYAFRCAMCGNEIESIPSMISMSHEDHMRMQHPHWCPQDEGFASVEVIDVETSKIRKHTNDTLWAVLAGFISAGVLVVIMTLIVLGILFFAQGR